MWIIDSKGKFWSFLAAIAAAGVVWMIAAHKAIEWILGTRRKE